MSYQEARRVPTQELLALWRANERRLARKELRLIDDLLAVGGLQSPVEVEGEKKKPRKRVKTIGLDKRRGDLTREGYPHRVIRSLDTQAKQLQALREALLSGQALPVVEIEA